MRHKKLTFIVLLAAAVTLVAAATAMAAPKAQPVETSSTDITAETQITCEVDTETGLITVDGEVVGALDPGNPEPEAAVTTTTLMGEEGPVQITMTPQGAEMSYEIISSTEDGADRSAVFQWTDNAE